MERYSIQVLTLGQTPIAYSIPRIYFKFTTKYGASYEITRIQFPLRLAYAFTFNKAQGQTFNKVLIDLTHDVFAHGFLYVGMSRVRRYDSICFFVGNEEQYFESAPAKELSKSVPSSS